MRAFRFFNWQEPARLVDLPVPEPAAGQVLVKVGGNGICQSDLHLMHDWSASPPHLDITLPMTVGHEIGGWIESLGPGVTGLDCGQPCLITIAGCGQCRPCAQGWNNYCRNLPGQPGMGLDGGLADYVLADAGSIVRIDSLMPWEAAPLTDAGLSSYHAVKRVLPLLEPGSVVVVIGIGGLGHMAIAALKAVCAAEIIAVDHNEQALELASELGADHCIDTSEPGELSEEAAVTRVHIDAVLDFVGSGETIDLAAKWIGPLGHIVVAGRGSGIFEYTNGTLPYGAMLSTTFGGSRRELLELVSLAEAGRIQTRITRFPLEDTVHAFESLDRGEIRGRAVIIPQDSPHEETVRTVARTQ